MNKKYILITALYGFMLLTAACKKELLNPVSQTTVASDNAFDTALRIENQALSLYGSLKNGNFYGGRYVVYGNLRGEDFINETSNLVTASDVWSMNVANSATSVKTLWSQGYLTINRCNVFIDGMTAKGTAVVGAPATAKYIAEARLIRALSYYSLLQVFARPYLDGNGNKPGLPLRLTGITAPGSSDLVRSTVAQIYDQIIADLNFAETNLALTNTTSNVTRAHRNTAIALKTRVYLSMGKYAEVITEANKIVPAVAPFKATSGVPNEMQADLASVFKTYTTAESIFSLPMTSSAIPLDNPGTQNSLASYFYMTASVPGTTEYSLNSTGVLANTEWKAADKRRALIFNKADGKKYLAKFTAPSPYTDWAPVIRWSEVLLNLAEARVRSSNSIDPQALLLINAVRQRSDATTIIAPASITEFTDALLLERRIEFLGEGLRGPDLTRLLLAIPAKGSAPSKGPAESGYIWPISSDELSLNKLMTDN
ncbi:RagB/SusD family nutrient uptake outer membrane protein [Pedobacter cryoconitis]|uniref:SusD-like starch-binding protein associating with outer membrane n=1 Tax=Pedobacter cryoconitis TaxID=188932 RepID=A0A327SGU4_9SPHI|nr:RagB/SusD family nutrient uptake outer membrane protein [Pedobacter cryoconitis]RAJ28309.1 SusD-like starch-binding protein associating with outer membrane [Pedobacter cryoconitis]